MGLVFSFPGLVQGIDDSIKYTALSSDMARAELVSNTLTKGINDALAFIKTYSGKEHISGEEAEAEHSIRVKRVVLKDLVFFR